jgi:hypothetical protein
MVRQAHHQLRQAHYKPEQRRRIGEFVNWLKQFAGGGGQFSLSDSEKDYIVSVLLGLYKMMICNLRFLLLRHPFPMYMTVGLMVIDTQDTLALREHAFPAFRRSL